MSTGNQGTPVARAVDWAGSPRALALAGGVVLTVTYLVVLHRTVDVTGQAIGTDVFYAVVIGSTGLAILFAQAVEVREAILVAAVLLGAGLVAYFLSVPASAIDLGRQVTDTAALLTGLSILQITRADVWALGLTPAPVFLTGYLLLRRAYGPAVLAGGATLALFVLTSDAGTVHALVGVLGAVAVLGFGHLDGLGASPLQQRSLLVVLVAMAVVTTSVSVVPGGEARPLLTEGGPNTVEASLIESASNIGVVGSIRLSPSVRFTVTADEPRFWRVGAYDRYTGAGWVRTGGTEAYGEPLQPPPDANARPVSQTFQPETSVSSMPAAWKPRTVESEDVAVSVTDLGGFEPDATIGPGQAYTVRSLVSDPPAERLARAGRDYPAAVSERYLQLPESTPDRLGEFTTNLTSSATSPYAEAVMIEQWLETNKGYALNVERPPGDVASVFVFEMERGYCTYYASAMVAMLRTQGIPARFAVGYTSGQQVDENRWVVRGLNAHAWVEVYFPDVGWVQFDPTPSGPRESFRIARLQFARENGEADVDTNVSAAVPITPVSFNTTGNGTALNVSTEEGTPIGANATGSGDIDVGDDEGPRGEAATPESLLYRAILLLGGLTLAYQLGVFGRLYRAFWLRRLPDGPPRRRIEAAADRAEYILGRRYRPRRAGETRRAYLAAIGLGRSRPGSGADPAAELFRLGERARYAGRATGREAREAAALLEALREEPGPAG